MAHTSIVNRSRILATATALSAAGLLVNPAPAQASPMFPLAPACKQYGFGGAFSLRQDNGFRVSFSSTGPTARGSATAVGGSGATMRGTVTGGIQGRNVDFTIRFDQSTGRYRGVVGDDGLVRGGKTIDEVYVDELFAKTAAWDSVSPLVCADAPPPPPPSVPSPTSVPPTGPAVARLGVAVQGPTTLRAGQGAPYTVILSNPGDAAAPVELFISYGGQLRQTDQVTPAGGVNCGVVTNAGGTTAVRCTAQQLAPKATASIVVQGRGSAPGSGTLGVTINSADPVPSLRRSRKS